MSPPDDEELVAVFRREFPRLVRTAYVVLQDQAAAEDVAQEAFGQLHRHWAKVREYDNPAAWLRRVAIRAAVRVARREEMRRHLTSRLSAEGSTAERDLDLAHALSTLPARQRAVVALHYYEDRSAEEVGALLGCSASTVRTHLGRARARLAELLAEEEADHAE